MVTNNFAYLTMTKSQSITRFMCTVSFFSISRTRELANSSKKVSFTLSVKNITEVITNQDEKTHAVTVYDGEVDESGQKFGHGKIIHFGQILYEGTFFEDMRHGIGKNLISS